MKRRVSAVEARKRLGELLEDVHRGDEVVIERAGKPMAVMVPAKRYDALERNRNRILDFMERAQERNLDLTADEIAEEVDAAIAEVRRLRRTAG